MVIPIILCYWVPAKVVIPAILAGWLLFHMLLKNYDEEND